MTKGKMMQRLLRIGLCATALLLCGGADGPVESQENPPAAVTVKAPRFEADTTQVPELQPWGRAAEALCETWYPKVVAILESNDAERPLAPVVRIIFEKDMKGVAYARGSEIHIAAHWVKSHPNDFGMVAHELTHLVQRYPRNRAGWLVEGIADYVRLQHFEPALTRPKIDFTKAKHTDAYKTTAAFLIHLEERYGRGVVPKLHAALRAGRYTDELFQEITGKEIPALWADFAAAEKCEPRPIRH